MFGALAFYDQNSPHAPETPRLCPSMFSSLAKFFGCGSEAPQAWYGTLLAGFAAGFLLGSLLRVFVSLAIRNPLQGFDNWVYSSGFPEIEEEATHIAFPASNAETCSTFDLSLPVQIC